MAGYPRPSGTNTRRRVLPGVVRDAIRVIELQIIERVLPKIVTQRYMFRSCPVGLCNMQRINAAGRLCFDQKIPTESLTQCDCHSNKTCLL